MWEKCIMSERVNIGFLKDQIKKKIPIREVISSRLGPDERSWLCPFHDDKQAGSFKVWDQTNRFRCFSCEKSGDAIDFVMETDKISWVEAVYKLSVEYKLITPEEYKEHTHRAYSGPRKTAGNIKSSSSASVKDPELLDFVYSLMCEGDHLVDAAKPTLTIEHRKYLNGRGITDAEIDRFGYFSMPGKEIIPILQRRLKNLGYDEDDLLGIPGFYQWKETGKIDMPVYDGIGIPIRNVDEQIVALQIRKDKAKEGDSRYCYFSSSFANSPAWAVNCRYGCGPSQTAGFLPGTKEEFKGVLITEGFFKAAQWVLWKESPAITIQGVNNTKDVLPMLESLPMVENVLFAYDMEENVNTEKAAQKLNSQIKEAGYRTYFLKWDEKDGKGLDDVILNGKADTIRIVKG